MKYFSESHRKSSEAAQRAVEEMMKHPLSVEQQREQILRNKGLLDDPNTMENAPTE